MDTVMVMVMVMVMDTVTVTALEQALEQVTSWAPSPITQLREYSPVVCFISFCREVVSNNF